MNFNYDQIVAKECDDSELFEEGYFFTHYFVPPNEHKYISGVDLGRTSCDYNTTGYDVIFTVEEDGHEILGHRKTLSTKSVYFQTMFSGYFLEANALYIKIHGVSARALKKLVKFCYTNYIKFKSFDVIEIVAAANLMLFCDVVENGLIYMESLLQPQTCLEIYIFAQEYKFEEMAKIAINYAKYYFLQVSRTNQFLGISFEIFTNLIKDQKKIVQLRCLSYLNPIKMLHSPLQLFDTVLKWVNYDENVRKDYINDLLGHIPFSDFSVELYKEYLTDFEKLGIKYDWKQSDEHLDNQRNTLYNPDTNEFIVFKIRRDELLTFCPIFNGCRMLTKFDYNFQHIGAGTCLFEDKIILAGGINWENWNKAWRSGTKVINNVAYLSLQNCQLYELPSMQIARQSPSVIVLNAAIYVCGGENALLNCKPNYLNCVERYDMVYKQWTFVAPMITKRAYFSTCAIGNNQIYALGESKPFPHGSYNDFRELIVECYSTEKNEWNMRAKLTPDIENYIYGLCFADKNFVFNGVLYAFIALNHKAVIFKYDVESNSWILVQDKFEYNYYGIHTRCMPLIYGKENKLFVAGRFTLLNTFDSFGIYMIDTISGSCQMISQAKSNWFSVSKKILSQNSIFNPDILYPNKRIHE